MLNPLTHLNNWISPFLHLCTIFWTIRRLTHWKKMEYSLSLPIYYILKPGNKISFSGLATTWRQPWSRSCRCQIIRIQWGRSKTSNTSIFFVYSIITYITAINVACGGNAFRRHWSEHCNFKAWIFDWLESDDPRSLRNDVAARGTVSIYYDHSESSSMVGYIDNSPVSASKPMLGKAIKQGRWELVYTFLHHFQFLITYI